MDKSNNLKLAFATTINDMCDNLPKSRGGCFDYGSMSGCDIGCPALWDGECDVIGEVLDNVEMDEEEEISLKKLYKDDL